MEREKTNNCSCNFESEDDFDNRKFHLKDCQQDSKMRRKIAAETRLSGSHRKKKKVKKRSKQSVKKQSDLITTNYESQSECFGDSEKSDSDDDSVNASHVADLKVSRKMFAKTRQSLAEEQLENNSKGELVCLTCLKRFSNIQNLRRHLRLHLKRDSNIPDFDSDSENCDNNSKRFLCDFCPEKFENKSAFLVHEKTHISQELLCYVCRKTYSDRYSLRYHLRTHGIGQQIRCELCGKNFTKQSRLQSHIDSFHKDIRKFQCTHCDKAFKAKIHLENHFLQHSGERPHKCDECGDTFRHKLSLVTHMRVHDDSRPYICDTCGKAFRDSSTLKAHTRVHSGDKPYKCNLCDKSFTQRAGLNYHKSVHSGSKPHKCNECEYATAKKSSLTIHIKTMHKKNDPVSQVSATVSVSSTTKTIEIKCVEKTCANSPPLPSPPTQHGDAVFTERHNSHEQKRFQETLSTSLPSFNILKSYDSPSLHDSIVQDTIKLQTDNASACSESGGSSEDRHSPYGGHSDPSLSPPLTPPIQDYQDHSHNLQSFSYHPSFNRPHSYSFSSASPLNYSTNQSFCKEYSDRLEQTNHSQDFARGPSLHPSYGHQAQGQVNCRGMARKSFTEYQNYYGVSPYGALHYYHQKVEQVNHTGEQQGEEGKRKFYDRAGMGEDHLFHNYECS